MARLILPLLVVLVGSCTERTTPASPPPAQVEIPYRLSDPDTIFVLPEELREASGLAMLPSGQLATLHDEAGIVFEIDPATGVVTNQTLFRDRGDFEGIEWADGALWALRSDGTLFRLVTGQPVEEIETDLASRNDTEGLGWDGAKGRLLIAAKADPGEGLGRVRAVYGFDTESRTLSAAPVFSLDRDVLDTDEADFRPSAIAVHPGTGHVYVLSSDRKAIAVLSAEGRLLAVRDLAPLLFPQPEGIAFLPDATLFIESEGPDGPATLLRFSPVAR